MKEGLCVCPSASASVQQLVGHWERLINVPTDRQTQTEPTGHLDWTGTIDAAVKKVRMTDRQ